MLIVQWRRRYDMHDHQLAVTLLLRGVLVELGVHLVKFGLVVYGPSVEGWLAADASEDVIKGLGEGIAGGVFSAQMGHVLARFWVNPYAPGLGSGDEFLQGLVV